MNYGQYHLLVLLNVDYIHICYHYNVFFFKFNIIRVFIYLFVLLFQLDAHKRLSFSLSQLTFLLLFIIIIKVLLGTLHLWLSTHIILDYT